MQQKKEEAEKLTWDERRERDAKREKGPKHFSAFKEMERNQKPLHKRENRKDRGQGRRGREGRGRDRSRSPPPAENKPAEPVAAAGEKRPREEDPVEESPSLFSNKREKLDTAEVEDGQSGKRGADEELLGDAKKAKVDGQ